MITYESGKEVEEYYKSCAGCVRGNERSKYCISAKDKERFENNSLLLILALIVDTI